MTKNTAWTVILELLAMMDMKQSINPIWGWSTFWSQYARTTTVTFDEMTRTLSLSIFFKRMAAWKSRIWMCWGRQIIFVIANNWSQRQTSSWKVRDHLRLIRVWAEWMGLAHSLGSFHFGHWFISSTWTGKKDCNLTIRYNCEGFHCRNVCDKHLQAKQKCRF